MDRWSRVLATFFYTGKIPWAPGTMGSLAGLLLYIGFAESFKARFAIFVVLCVLGFFSCGRAERILGKKDPKEVVIDEVCGIFLVFFGISLNVPVLLSGFFLYRVLDITKPFPVRRLEKLPGSFGIMSDDLLCGLYANLILRIAMRWDILKF